MIIVDNKVIETPVKDIILSLKQELNFRHINKLESIEVKNNNIRVTCPIHSGGHERTASCDILMVEKDGLPEGTVHCFGCGYRANLIKFIANCLDFNYREAIEWLLDNASYSYLEDTRFIEDIDLITNTSNVKTVPQVPLDELRQYDYIHPYMFKRKLTDDIIYKFEVGYDPKTDSITFPVYVDGKCQMVVKRRVKYKRFDMPKIDPKPIYGLDYLTGDEVIVCESIINALTCYRYGREAVALLGTGSSYQIDLLKKIKQRKIILALDGDQAGKAGIKRLQDALDNKIVTVLQLPDGKDINDLTEEEFNSLEESYW